jgi:uncharacterized membrane protein
LGADHAREAEKETSRLEAFSDGVFAIAITLLALNLQVPHMEGGDGKWALAHALGRQWPSYVAFVTSFFTILVMWINHHGMFKLIHKASSQLLFANGFLLMMTTAVPFSTGVLSEYFGKPGAQVACAVYGGTFVLISLGYTFVWRCIINNRALLRPGASEASITKITKSYVWGAPLYILATLCAFLNIYLTLGICTVLWIFWAATAREL